MQYGELSFLEYIREPLLVIVQNLFCDEGGKYQSGNVVSFSGVVVSPSRLAGFNDEWNALLRSYELESFHMKDLADVYSAHGPKLSRDQTIDQRTKALLPFSDCINKHLEIGFIQVWDVLGYAALPTEAKAKLGGSESDPHYLAFTRAILEISNQLNSDDRASIVCDDDLIKAWDCYLHYRQICKVMPEISKKFASLTFARDANFPALQAADMIAFLSRLEAAARFHNDENKWLKLFNHLVTEPKAGAGLMRWFAMFADETRLLGLANSLEKPLTEP
jgi:hypothetical protein